MINETYWIQCLATVFQCRCIQLPVVILQRFISNIIQRGWVKQR